MTKTVVEAEPEDLTEYFEYLDDLRVSGETNMYGAASYLCQEFGLERNFAREVLGAWMKTFGDGSPSERAMIAAGGSS